MNVKWAVILLCLIVFITINEAKKSEKKTKHKQELENPKRSEFSKNKYEKSGHKEETKIENKNLNKKHKPSDQTREKVKLEKPEENKRTKQKREATIKENKVEDQVDVVDAKESEDNIAGHKCPKVMKDKKVEKKVNEIKKSKQKEITKPEKENTAKEKIVEVEEMQKFLVNDELTKDSENVENPIAE